MFIKNDFIKKKKNCEGSFNYNTTKKHFFFINKMYCFTYNCNYYISLQN